MKLVRCKLEYSNNRQANVGDMPVHMPVDMHKGEKKVLSAEEKQEKYSPRRHEGHEEKQKNVVFSKGILSDIEVSTDVNVT